MGPRISRLQKPHLLDAQKEPRRTRLGRISLQPPLDQESRLKNYKIQQRVTRPIQHPWIQRTYPLIQFENKLQAVVYTYIVSQLLTSDEKKFLFITFKELDKNNDGVIESCELFEALKDRKDISEERVKFLMRVIDTNGSGHIDYTEFLVAGINPKKFLTEQHF